MNIKDSVNGLVLRLTVPGLMWYGLYHAFWLMRETPEEMSFAFIGLVISVGYSTYLAVTGGLRKNVKDIMVILEGKVR